jgi:D-alanyl-D-alanine-carboxypeptidase/D-alanyl-D-alanine-endopeptidase
MGEFGVPTFPTTGERNLRFAAFLISLMFSNVIFAQPSSTVASDASQSVEGFWLGTLHAPSITLRIQLTITTEGGQLACSLDSLDQDSFGLPCSNIIYSDKKLSFDIPVVKGHWNGRMSEDAKKLAGNWNQGGEAPLDFERQDKIQPPPAPPVVHYDQEMAPVNAADMESVLRRDLDQALKEGDLAPATSAGVAIGVFRKGVRRVFAYGAAKSDSIFEIGSITKTFTGLILAQMGQQGQVRLDEPIRELLPIGTVAKPDGPEITLLDLVTQHSGLPRMPDNFKPADPTNPYADYAVPDLYTYVAQHGVKKPADAGFLYSNVGVGLLGQALANRGGLAYAKLLRKEVTDPLGMNDTSISLSESQERRFIPGHLSNHQPAHAWDLNAFAGAGGVRSTAGDMLKYLEAQLHPENIKLSNSPNAQTLPAAIIQSHKLQADAEPGSKIAFAWMFNSKFAYWHNGATGGYSSIAFFNPDEDFAAIVLLNTAISKRRTFEEMLAEHIAERFMGRPAISLGPVE